MSSGHFRFLAACVLLWLQSAVEARAQSPFAELAAHSILNSSRLLYAWNSSGDKFAYYQAGAISVVDLVTGKTKSVARLELTSDCSLLWPPPDKSIVSACPHSLSSIDARSGRSKRLVKSQAGLSNAAYSPDGAFITFIRDHNLCEIPAAGGAIRQLTTNGSDQLLVAEADPLYAHEFHLATAYWWSPDSSLIAYLETDRSRSGPYPPPGKALPSISLKLLSPMSGETREVAAADADTPYLAGVAWLPDSKLIAFETLNRLQSKLDLSLYDTGTSSSRHLLTQKDPYWINLPGAPVFVENGTKFLLTSELSGYRRICLYDIDGHLDRYMTPDKMEVSGVLSAPPSQPAAYFSTLTGNMHDLQLYRVSFDGSAPQLITKESGWHQASVSPGGKAFLDIASTSDRSPSILLRQADGSEIASIATPVTATVPQSEFLEIRMHDEVRLPAMLWKPRDFDPLKKYPVILFTYSGPGDHVVKNAWGDWQNSWNRFMATRGYLVVAVDARGSGGYGHYFEEYIHYRFGAQEVADLREVFSYLGRQPYVDAKRMGIWGCDYGAHIVVHAMLEFPNGFKAGFADSPITDWTLYDAYFTERYLGLPARRFTEYSSSSALDNARRLQGALLVAGSPANPFLHTDQLTSLKNALAKARKPLESIEFPEPDYRENVASLAALMKRMADFFDVNL